MGKPCFLLRVFVVFCYFQPWSFAAPSGSPENTDASQFSQFASRLLLEIDYDKFGFTRHGASLSTFGVGHMLANLNSGLVNISTHGFENILKGYSNEVSSQYARLIEKLNKTGFASKTVVYSSKPLPKAEYAENLHIEVANATFDVFKAPYEWKTTWRVMNDMIYDNTKGKINDLLVPKGNTLGFGFYPFIESVFINTNFYRGDWKNRWTDIGTLNISDGSMVEFMETEGNFVTRKHEKFFAVSVPLQDQSKSVVFVMPKEDLAETLHDVLYELMQNNNADMWSVQSQSNRIQIPKFNASDLLTYNEALQKLGLNDTFCPDEAFDKRSSNSSNLSEGGLKTPDFAGSVVQAAFTDFTNDFIGIYSATGASINSIQKLQNLRETPPKVEGKSEVRNEAVPNIFSGDEVKEGKSTEMKTLRFDRPFLWYVNDNEMGPLHYGIFTTKQKEDDGDHEDNFVIDLAKASYWTCPQIQG